MISLAVLKAHLKVDADMVDDDALIVEMEQGAVAIMEEETGCYFGQVADLTEILTSRGWGPIPLRAAPVDDDYPLILERRASAGSEWSEVDAADYEIDGQRLFPLVWWTPGDRSLRATYVGGFEEGREPADVRKAVRELVTLQYQHRLPLVTGTTVAELPYSVQQVIRAHKIVVV